ncbi:MAG: dockerin type I domain-containing protein [Pirellulaceae bacterium]
MLRNRRLRVETLERRELLAGDLIGRTYVDQTEAAQIMVHSEETSYFLHDDGLHGREVWATEGDSFNTRMIADVTPGPGSSFIDEMMATETGAVFVVKTQAGYELWQTDGTSGGTERLTTFSPTVPGQDAILGVIGTGAFVDQDFNSILFVPFNGDPPVALEPNSGRGELTFVEATSGRVLFVERSSFDGERLWTSDGSEAGTLRVTGNGFFPSQDHSQRVLATVTHGERFYAVISQNDQDTRLLRIDEDDSSDQITGDTPLRDDVDLSIASDKLILEMDNDLLYVDGDSSTYSWAANIAYENSSTADENSIIFPYYDSGTNDHFWGKRDLLTGESTWLTNSWRIFVAEGQKEVDYINAGNWLVYLTHSNAEVWITTYDLIAEEVTFIEKLDEGETVDFLVSKDSKVSYLVTGNSQSKLKMVDLDNRDHQPSTTRALPTIDSIGHSDSMVYAWTRNSVLRFLVKLDLDADLTATGTGIGVGLGTAGILRSYENSTIALPQPNPFIADRRSVERIDDQKFVIEDEDGFWISNGEFAGATVVDDPRTSTIPRDRASFRSADQTALVYELERADQFLRIVHTEENDIVHERIMIPDVTDIGIAEDRLIYFANDDVWQLNHDQTDASQATRLVENYHERTLQPLNQADLNDSDPYALRVFDERTVYTDHFNTLVYASDGTPSGTGLIDSTDAIRERIGVEGIVDVRQSNGAYWGNISGENPVILVERPTEAFLQPVFPIDSGRSASEVYRLRNSWFIRARLNGDPTAWIWHDSQPHPVMIDEPVQGSGSHRNLRLEKDDVLYHAVDPFAGKPAIDIWAVRDGQTTSVDSLVDVATPVRQFHIVGETTDQVIIALTTEGESVDHELFLWNGSRDRFTPFDAVNQFIADEGLHGISIDNPDPPLHVIVQANAAILFHRGDIYRIPLSEKTIDLGAGPATITINDSEIAIASESTNQVHDQPSELLTVNAEDIDAPIFIDIDGTDSLPLNGLKVKAPRDGTVYLSPKNIDRNINYQLDENQVTIVIGGHKIWIEFDGDIAIIERGATLPDGENRNRHFNFQVADAVVNVLGDGAGTVVQSSTGNGVAQVKIEDRIDFLLLGEMHVDQDVSIGATANIGQVNLHGTNASLLDLDLSFVNEIQIETTVTYFGGGRLVFANHQNTRYAMNISQSPLHNPFVRFDSDGNNSVTPADILTVINHLADKRGYETTDENLYPDVSGDRQVTPLDILEVINYLADNAAPSGEMARATPPSAANSSNDFVMTNWYDDDDEREVGRWEQASLF